MLLEWLTNDKNQHISFFILCFSIVMFCNLYSLKIDRKTRKNINNDIVRVLILSFIAYYSNIDINICFVISISYIFLLKMILDTEVNESFENLEKFTEIYKK